jgi:hypothetical protein
MSNRMNASIISRFQSRRFLIAALIAFTNVVILISLFATASRPAQAQDQIVPLPTTVSNTNAALALVNPESTQEAPDEAPVVMLQGFGILYTDAGEVTLGWDDNGTAEQVFVERTNDQSVTWTSIASIGVDQEEFTDTGIVNGMSYGYRGRLASQPVETATVVWYDAGSFNVLSNGGMEYDSNTDKLPDGWKTKNLTGDKIASNRVNDPLKPNKLFALEGKNAFVFKAPAAKNKKMIQDVSDIEASAGDQMTFKAFSRAKNLSADAKVAVKVMYFLSDGTRQNVKTVFNAGSYGYTETVSAPFVAPQNFDDARVVVIFRAGEGKWYLDNLRLLHTEAQ